MTVETVTVRRLSSGEIAEPSRDWQAVYELCCRTGNNGEPIAGDRWDFFARLWVGPYKQILPEWTYVAEAGSVIFGYLTGCPDSRAFAKAKFLRFSLPLLTDVFCSRYPDNRDARRFVRQMFRLENGPERAFPRGLNRKLWQDYPAHLHINVAAGWRRSGAGTRLMDEFFSDLRRAQIPGVHVYCGADPLHFYRRRGFEELAKIAFHGAPVYALGLRLRD